MKTTNSRTKRAMASLAVALAALALLPAARANTTTVDGRTWTYTLSGANATLTGVNPVPATLTVPHILDGHSLVAIGAEAFKGSPNLVKLTVIGPATIGSEAFSGCTGLTNVSMSTQVKTIGTEAFAGCTNLPSVSIPASVTDIGVGAFSRCSRLSIIKVADGNQNYAAVANVLFSKDKRILVCYPGGKVGNYSCDNWPDETVAIAAKAFAGCARLGSVGIPASVETIGEYAFSDSALTALLSGTGVKTIGGFAFSGCTNLTGVAGCCQGVTTIPWGMCFGCTKLGEITFGDGVAEIEGHAFNGCSSLQNVAFGKGLTSIGDYAFQRCGKLPGLVFPVNLTSIGNYAFGRCTSMKTVFFHDGMESVGTQAFNNSALETLYAPGAWEGTDKLANAGLPAGCTVIYRTSLKTVWRFYSKAYKGHFYTISAAEKLKLVSSNPNWKFEKGVYRAYTDEMAGTVPLHRFYSAANKGHFFTIKESEKAKLSAANSGWKYEGVAYYVYSEEVSGSVPVHRFWSAGARHHFFTADAAEKEALCAGNSGWRYEGIAFWARPADPATATTAVEQTVWRFYSATTKGHFYTISDDEALKLIANSGWKFENGVFRAYPKAVTGTVPLYRFYSSSAKGHFFTIKESEKAKLMPTNSGWKYEGIAYYVYPGEVAGSVPVFRFWNASVRHHFYTANTAQRDSLIAGNSGWKYEGIAFWALPLDDTPAAAANAAAPKANAAPRAVRKATTASVEAGAEGVGGTSGVGGTAASIRAAVTTSDGSDGSAVADGDEGTAWTVDATDGAWVVLSFAAAREVAEVEVVGENLPEGMRVLLSEDAEVWWEGEGGAARYVWVAFPAGTGPVTVREVLVGDSGAR